MRRAALVALLWLAADASAHPLAPGLLALDESRDGARAVLRFLAPRAAPDARVLLPSICSERPLADAARELDCGGALVGRRLGVAGLDGSGAEVLARVRTADGRTIVSWLREGDASFAVPARAAPSELFTDHVRLGVGHLLGGLDHLLFVTGLVLLLGLGRRLGLAVTAFTLGHSATLAAAVLGIARPPAAAIEPAIAATLVWLAWEIARGVERGAHERGMARRPLALPFAFGLLHGLGFAAALDWLGVARADLPVALIGFNLGIELGQLAWIALVGAAGLVLRSTAPALLSVRALRLAPLYAIGTLGVYWLLVRIAAIPAGL